MKIETFNKIRLGLLTIILLVTLVSFYLPTFRVTESGEYLDIGVTGFSGSDLIEEIMEDDQEGLEEVEGYFSILNTALTIGVGLVVVGLVLVILTKSEVFPIVILVVVFLFVVLPLLGLLQLFEIAWVDIDSGIDLDIGSGSLLQKSFTWIFAILSLVFLFLGRPLKKLFNVEY